MPNLVRLGLLDTPNKDDLTPLHIAAKQNHIKLLEALIEAGALISKSNGNGETAFYFAVQNKNKKTVSTLLKANPNPNLNCQLTENGTTLLIAAVLNGSLDIVNLLIKAGANINQAMAEGFSPLLIATKWGFLDIARALITNGADINQKTLKGSSPLSVALESGDVACASLLIKLGADVNEVFESGFSPIHIAVEDGEQELVEELVEAGADFNKTANDKEGLTPLCIAAETCLEMVQLLIRLGADINQTASDNKSPLLFAVINDSYDVVNYLLSFKHCKVIAFQTIPKDLLHIIEVCGDDEDAVSRAEEFIKTKTVDVNGKIDVLPHKIAAIFNRNNIQKLFEDKMQTLTNTHSNYRFYSSKQENQPTKFQSENKAALAPR